MSTYLDKLRDPRWQKKRLQILERDHFACQECGCDSKTLHVHHTRYVKGRDPWDYLNGFLVTLCETCHEQLHEFPESVIEFLADSFYQHGATWNVLWRLVLSIDQSLPADFKLSPADWSSAFGAMEDRLQEIVRASEE
jgi:hypothetical protein